MQRCGSSTVLKVFLFSHRVNQHKRNSFNLLRCSTRTYTEYFFFFLSVYLHNYFVWRLFSFYNLFVIGQRVLRTDNATKNTLFSFIYYISCVNINPHRDIQEEGKKNMEHTIQDLMSTTGCVDHWYTIYVLYACVCVCVQISPCNEQKHNNNNKMSHYPFDTDNARGSLR